MDTRSVRLHKSGNGKVKEVLSEVKRKVLVIVLCMAYLWLLSLIICRPASALVLLSVRHGRDRRGVFLQVEGRCFPGVPRKRTGSFPGKF